MKYAKQQSGASQLQAAKRDRSVILDTWKVKNIAEQLGYKNLATLKEKGVVIEVNTAEGKMRYDIYSKPHIHLICQRCGAIEDVDYDKSLFEYQTTLEHMKSVKIDRMDVIASVESCKLCRKK